MFKTDTMLQPYGHLATSMNYWRVMVPAPQPGISVLCEVSQAMDDGQLMAFPVPSPAVPPAALDDWRIEHLIYAVGLPVPADLALVKDAGSQQALASLDALRAHDPATLDFSQLFDKWTTVARPIAGVSFTNVTAKLAHQWLALADRTFIDEVDVFPAVAIGDPPAAGLTERQFFTRLSPTSRPELGGRCLLQSGHREAEARARPDRPRWRAAAGCARQAVEHRSGDAPRVQVRQPPVRRDVQQHAVRPRQRRHPYACLRVQDWDDVRGREDHRRDSRRASSGPERAYAGAAGADAAQSDTANYQVFAHELSHNMGLGDEYDEFGTKFTGAEADLDDDANLTTPGTFQNADGSVRVDDIKWNWHRIRKAAVLTKKPKPVGGLVHAYMHLASGFQFAPGDKVRLRKRERRKVIRRPTVTSAVEFTVKEVHKNNPDDPADTQNMMLVLEPAGAVDFSPFDPDSLIYLPVPRLPRSRRPRSRISRWCLPRPSG